MASTTTTITEFRDSLFTLFDTQWTALNPTIPIAWPNYDFATDALGILDTDAWINVTLAGDPDGDTQFGSCFSQVFGTITLQVYVRGQHGLDQFYVLGQDLKDFLIQWYPTLDNGWLRSIRLVEIGFDGTWFVGNATADYTYFTNRAA